MRGAMLLVVAAACGNGGPGSDAAPKQCDYTEKSDATNDAQSEMTGLMIGAGTQELCGNLDNGHYDAVTKTVDLDTFRVTAAAQADLRVRFFGATGVENLTEFSVLVFSTDTAPVLLNGAYFDATLGDHGVFRASLPPGTYDIVVRARAGADIAAPIGYKVRFLPDLECPQIAKPSYTEQHDGASNTGNDQLAIDFSKNPVASMIAGTAESTGLKIDPFTQDRISGTAAMVSGPDGYMDRDTYVFTTGALTNELSVRLDWPGGADLDYVVFAAMATTPTGASTVASQTGPELAIFAAKPGTQYWLWVGAAKSSTTLPVTYDAAVCGEHAAP